MTNSKFIVIRRKTKIVYNNKKDTIKVYNYKKKGKNSLHL